MRITRVRVRHFRSLHDLVITVSPFTVLCGPNSAGKSNVLRAIEFAWRPEDEITPQQVYANLDYRKRDQRGGPTLAIRVEVDFADCPQTLCDEYGGDDGCLKYEFSATRKTATVNRKFNGHTVDQAAFERAKECFDIVYVPPIRDISAEGLKPFRRLLAKAAARARGDNSLRRVTDSARKVIQQQAEVLLKNGGFAIDRLGADGLRAGTDAIELDNLFDDLSIEVMFSGRAVELEAVGTGHQSEVVLSMYRQLGEAAPGDTVYLFEEPDNHLHPSLIRAVADDLVRLSESDQVIATSHSPILLNHVGYDSIRALKTNDDRETEPRKISVNMSEPQVRALMATLGVRATEPLLAQKVVVVEGPSDAVALAELHRLRTGKTPDQCDVLLIPAGGKDLLVRVCSLLQGLDVDWYAMVDNDAADCGYPPILTEQAEDLDAGTQTCLTSLLATVDDATKRGRKAGKLIESILDELNGAPPSVVRYDGSHVERLVACAGILMPAERNQLASRLKKGQLLLPRTLLKKSRVFLCESTLEESLLRNAGAVDVVSGVFVRNGQQAVGGADPDARRQSAVRRLHGKAGEPEILREVVEGLEGAALLGRTDLNLCFKYVFEQ